MMGQRRRRRGLLGLALLLALLLLAWAPWLNNQAIYQEARRTRAMRDGTYGWVRCVDGSVRRMWVCDYTVRWALFGRWVASCEGAYYVTFWGQMLP